MTQSSSVPGAQPISATPGLAELSSRHSGCVLTAALGLVGVAIVLVDMAGRSNVRHQYDDASAQALTLAFISPFSAIPATLGVELSSWLLIRTWLGFGTVYKGTVLALLWSALVTTLGWRVAALTDSWVAGAVVSVPSALVGMAWVFGRFLRGRDGQPLGLEFGAKLVGFQVLPVVLFFAAIRALVGVFAKTML